METITFIETWYDAHETLCNVAILLLVFGGMARVAFWRDSDGLKVGGPLAVGLAGLLTVAMLKWARAEGHTITELGKYAGFILIEAIFVMGWAAFRKSSRS